MKKILSVFLIGTLMMICFSVNNTSHATYLTQDNIDDKNIIIWNEGKKIAKEDGEQTVDDVITDADKFIESGELVAQDNKDELGPTIDFLYNLLLAFGIIIAVIVGSLLGIKYMLGSVEEKAEYKETLLGYLISCVVVFGAFGIWKIVINILSSF